MAPAVLAQEPRLKVAILVLGGIAVLEPSIYSPLNYLPRVRQPVMFMSGEFDFMTTREMRETVFELLGSPEKKHLVYAMGHNLPPRSALVTDAANWLDTYLGPIE